MSEQEPGRRLRLPREAVAGIILAALVGLALYIRIALPYDQVFVKDWVWFRDTDAYYYLRHIENLIHNFPRLNALDPYMLYPGGSIGLHRPFFAWLIAGVALIGGGGSPAQHTIESVAAYMPALLGGLTIVPVYFIGRELFSRWAGLIAAALVAILPSEFLHRSLLGFADHHVAEVLFSTTAVLFLIMAVKRARERAITFRHLLDRDWAVIRRPLVYALLAGLFLGFYLLSWVGGLMFVFVIFAYLLVQFIVDHLRGRSTDYLCIVGTPVFLIAFLMLLPVLDAGSRDTAYRVSMSLAVVAPIVLSLISRFVTGRGWKPVFYPLALAILAGVGLGILRSVAPSLLAFMLAQFSIFSPAGAALTVMEVQPLSLPIAWANFTTSFFISFVALAMLAFATVRSRSADRTLFLVWSIIMLMAVLGQRRFGYYFAVNAALLTGYFSWKMLDLAGLGKLLAARKQPVPAVKEFRKKRKKTRDRPRAGTFMQPRGPWLRVVAVGIAIFFLVFYPNIGGARRLAAMPNFVIHEGWYTSLEWLRENSPEPFGEAGYYYELYPSRAEFEYPDSAYGVMSWWDYGYFITQIGRRTPNANPTQAGARQAGRYFTAQDEASANEQLDALDSRYVVIDYTMPTGKFYAMVEWAGGNVSQFFETHYYHRQEAGTIMPVPLSYPAYYYSATARLYLFDGKEQPGSNTLVVCYEERVSSDGIRYRLISSARLFSSYADAEAYVSRRQLTDCRLVGAFVIGNTVVRYEQRVSEEGIHYEEITDIVYFPEPQYDCRHAMDFIANQQTDNYKILDPFISPVPLEGLEHYELRHNSDSLHTFKATCKQLPRVKVFEYLEH